MIDAFVIRDREGRRVAAAWDAVTAYEKLTVRRGCAVERVAVSGRRRDVRRRRAAALRAAGDRVPPMPVGYALMRRAAPLAISTLRARPWTNWSRTLADIAASDELGTRWVPYDAGGYGTSVHALHARGMLDIAAHPYKRNLYRTTQRARRALRR